MSIIIKGMKMPRGCIECRFFEKSDEYCYARLAYGSEWGKSTGCPLVEIPPHGRLIDADELNRKMYHDAFETDSDMQKWDSGCWVRYKMFENNLRDALTIIEAEEAKE